MATPHVAGAAALIASLGVTDPGAIERVIASSADGQSLDKEKYGAGLLDAGGAVRTVTLWWTVWRIALAALGAFIALFHARRLGHIRARGSAPVGLWPVLFLGAGGLALLAPAGLARASGLSLLALPLPALPERFLGPAGTSFVASLAAYAAWSAIVPLAIAMIARVAMPLRGIAAGLAFAQAGVLLHAAFFRTIYLPYLPAMLVPFWLLAGSFIAWWLGRALLMPEPVR
jgi:serine protease